MERITNNWTVKERKPKEKKEPKQAETEYKPTLTRASYQRSLSGVRKWNVVVVTNTLTW